MGFNGAETGRSQTGRMDNNELLDRLRRTYKSAPQTQDVRSHFGRHTISPARAEKILEDTRNTAQFGVNWQENKKQLEGIIKNCPVLGDVPENVLRAAFFPNGEYKKNNVKRFIESLNNLLRQNQYFDKADLTPEWVTVNGRLENPAYDNGFHSNNEYAQD